MVVYKMGKARKADTVTKGATEVPTVNVEVVSDTQKKAKAPKVAKATKAVKEPEPVIAEPETTTETTEGVDTILADNFTQFLGKLAQITSQMNALKTEFRALEKKATRELKAAQKVNAKRKRKSGNRSPSGFVKPTLISDELAKFLSKPSGTEMARTEVTREINGYIRAHNLQDKQNGRKINPDASLASLLKIKSGEELTYFNLQRYMSPHFAKATTKSA
jgi:upstream activation factor subunit UAF30